MTSQQPDRLSFSIDQLGIMAVLGEFSKHALMAQHLLAGLFNKMNKEDELRAKCGDVLEGLQARLSKQLFELGNQFNGFVEECKKLFASNTTMCTKLQNYADEIERELSSFKLQIWPPAHNGRDKRDKRDETDHQNENAGNLGSTRINTNLDVGALNFLNHSLDSNKISFQVKEFSHSPDHKKAGSPPNQTSIQPDTNSWLKLTRTQENTVKLSLMEAEICNEVCYNLDDEDQSAKPLPSLVKYDLRGNQPSLLYAEQDRIQEKISVKSVQFNTPNQKPTLMEIPLSESGPNIAICQYRDAQKTQAVVAATYSEAMETYTTLWFKKLDAGQPSDQLQQIKIPHDRKSVLIDFVFESKYGLLFYKQKDKNKYVLKMFALLNDGRFFIIPMVKTILPTTEFRGASIAVRPITWKNPNQAIVALTFIDRIIVLCTAQNEMRHIVLAPRHEKMSTLPISQVKQMKLKDGESENIEISVFCS